MTNDKEEATTTTTTTTIVSGFLGIDIGTQGLSVLFCDETDLSVLATGESSYGFSTTKTEQHEKGWYEQHSRDWLQALQTAMQQIHSKLLLLLLGRSVKVQILAIGIAGQMHGEVLLDMNNQVLEPVRLWCDGRNVNEGAELTKLFEFKVPHRVTCARFLWTVRNQRHRAMQTRHITTPAGYIAFQLTGEYNLGIGDATGMFPVHPQKRIYDEDKMKLYNTLIEQSNNQNSNSDGTVVLPLNQLLPRICCAGDEAGYLTPQGATLLGLDSHLVAENRRIPVASAEGDQVSSLAGSLIGQAGTMSCSFGTSVCANFVADAVTTSKLVGVLPAVDHFAAADGKPFHMVLLRNGTTFLNTIVESYGHVGSTAATFVNDKDNGDDDKDGEDKGNAQQQQQQQQKNRAFELVMPALIQAPNDCGGLLALPFMDDEPGLGIHQGGSALILGWNAQNRHAGHVAKAALLSTIFNLKAGFQQFLQATTTTTTLSKTTTLSTTSSSTTGTNNDLAKEETMHKICLSGGLVKTPECGQIVADVFNLPVTLLLAAEEGCSCGACIMAQYRHYCCFPTTTTTTTSEPMDWATFLESIQQKQQQQQQQQVPKSSSDESIIMMSSPPPPPHSFVPDPDAVQIYEIMYQRYQQLLQVEPQLRKIMTEPI